MRAPLAWVAAAFALGIGLCWGLESSLGILFGFIAAAGLFLYRKGAANLGLLALILGLGAARGWVNAREPADSIAHRLTAGPRPIACDGVLVSDVEWSRPAQGQAQRQGWLELRRALSQTGWEPCSGKVRLRLPARGIPLGYGDQVRVWGTIRLPLTPTLSPERRGKRVRGFDEARWLWVNGGCGALTVTDPTGIVRVGGGCDFWTRVRRGIASFRGRLKELGRSLVGPEEAAYLEGLLLGDRQGIPEKLEEAFRRSGTVHVLVVSGLNVGLVGSLGGMILTFFRIPRGIRYGVLALFLISYCLLSGAQPPIVRATVMGVLICIAQGMGEEPSILNAVGLAALGVLAVHPRALADVSFQLSFAAVLGLLVLSPKLFKTVSDTLRVSDTIPRWLAQGFACSAGAWIAVTPFTAWHFHLLTPIALPANLIVVPWASLLIVTGFLLYGVGLIQPGWAGPFAASFQALARGLTGLVTWMAQLPGGSWVFT